MNKVAIIIVSLILAMVVVLSGCVTISPPAAKPTPPAPATFEPIEITGSGSMTTTPFTVTTNEWRIVWAYVPEHEMADFSFLVYPRGAPEGGWVEFIIIPEGITVGSTYIYADAGEYYIKVIASNAKSWVIVISPP